MASSRSQKTCTRRSCTRTARVLEGRDQAAQGRDVARGRAQAPPRGHQHRVAQRGQLGGGRCGWRAATVRPSAVAARGSPAPHHPARSAPRAALRPARCAASADAGHAEPTWGPRERCRLTRPASSQAQRGRARAPARQRALVPGDRRSLTGPQEPSALEAPCVSTATPGPGAGACTAAWRGAWGEGPDAGSCAGLCGIAGAAGPGAGACTAAWAGACGDGLDARSSIAVAPDTLCVATATAGPGEGACAAATTAQLPSPAPARQRSCHVVVGLVEGATVRETHRVVCKPHTPDGVPEAAPLRVAGGWRAQDTCS